MEEIRIEDLKVGKRYLFREQHIDGDDFFEAVLDEISPSTNFCKLVSPDGSFRWIILDAALRGVVTSPIEELPEDNGDMDETINILK